MAEPSTPERQRPMRHWPAQLRLAFEASARRTLMRRLGAHGPLYVQRPFYPEGETCHTILLHPPGGVAGGDELCIDVSAGPQSKSLITTPAATKFYRSNGFDAGCEQQLRLAAGACCEWLPLENLVFDGARVRSRLRVELAAGARFLGQEVWGLGRPARGERFECGQLAQRFQLTVAGRPLLTEQLVLDGGDVLARSPWGLNGQDAFGALYAYPVDREFATAQARRDGAAQAWGARSCGTRIAQSWVDELLIVRGTSTSLEALRRCLEREWVALRPHVIGLSAMRPRIWNT